MEWRVGPSRTHFFLYTPPLDNKDAVQMGNLRTYLRMARHAEDRVRGALRLNDSQSKLERDAQEFWTRQPKQQSSFWWHLRGSDPFVDDQLWLDIGKKHVNMYIDAARMVGFERPVETIVDWGCGGGANAIHFGAECKTLYGIDVSQDALDESVKQMQASQPQCNYVPIKIDVPDPESVLGKIPAGIDMFYCLYVWEVFPSQAYGQRILEIARKLLKPGGLGYVQIKYEKDVWTRSRRWGYTRGVANMTRYRVDQFWELIQAAGLQPRHLVLIPKPHEVPDFDYAYYFFQKPMDA